MLTRMNSHHSSYDFVGVAVAADDEKNGSGMIVRMRVVVFVVMVSVVNVVVLFVVVHVGRVGGDGLVVMVLPG